ncbi:3-phosphoshikimate 1-carboxyvinyltransferase [Candidatus Uzinura diaspidicola str. ASNER]|uniref:3-phosphoshikimate 1-carboxyvinyltransferase n=1 Tax=Candidatus Uzinura diaspidicola str. ASNER TaxID=1133592 RepID=L7VJW0_9FLAO|nr:3-phosphoshikimate 1-carboxyvinyltransferase [Candidatus Uzinura diaspidicola str. ASNER]
MKSIELKKNSSVINGAVRIGGSKSESNRLLIFRAIFPYHIYSIGNLSDSEDTHILNSVILNNNWLIDVDHAGTAMRFFTAYCTIQNSKMFFLKGSKRMHNRPIGILIEALTKLGAHIEYIKENKYPPIKVYGQRIKGGSILILSDISSQFVSALLLISFSTENGLELNLSKKITSEPYISMTVAMLRKIGIYVYWKYNKISVLHEYKKISIRNCFTESDWSSASYYYSLAAISEQANIYLSKYNNKKSIQGDRALIDIYYHNFGVLTIFYKNGFSLKKNTLPKVSDNLEFNLNKCPDIAQTLAITCTGLKTKCLLIGLETLKVKETDRLKSMRIELEKVGACVKHSENSLEIIHFKEYIQEPIFIDTYQDHRMAMAFSSLGLHKQLIIHNHDVVKKSYPPFWKDLKKLGLSIREL